MFSNHQHLSSPEVQELRREAGRLLKQLRDARGLSQRELCALVGGGVYTFISQLENGHGRIPPDKFRVWAEALGIEARDFVRMILPFYDPETAGILFGVEPPPTQDSRVKEAAVKPGLRLVSS